MRHRSVIPVALASVAMLSAAVSPPAFTKGPGDPEAPLVELRLGTLESESSPWWPAIETLVAETAARSDGSVTITITDGLELDHPGGPEAAVLQALRDGRIDLALVPSRGWADAGVASLRALQVPFLITDDALAEAVTSGDLGADLLAGLADVDVAGLTLWPDALRHPIAYTCVGRPFLRPEDLSGLRIRSVPSAETWALLAAAGATPVFESYDENATCALGGHESSIAVDIGPGLVATGNVTFWPRVHVLGGSAATLGGLAEEQRAALQGAADASPQAALAARIPEAALGARWCETFGMSIVEASAADLDAWSAVAAPLTAGLRADPVVGPLVDRIEALASETEPAPGAAPCGGMPGPSSVPAPSAGAASPGASTDAWSEGMWPDGTYRMELTARQVRDSGALDLLQMVGANTLTVEGGTFRLDIGDVELDRPGVCHGTAELRDGAVHTEWATTARCGGFADFLWREDADGLHLRVLSSNAIKVDRVWFETNPWTRIR